MTAQQSDGPAVAIVIPHTGSVSMRWAVRLATLEMPHHHIVTKSTGAIDMAREKTVQDALPADPEWLLFLDSDVVPPVDVFARLRRHDKPVVSALYYVDGEMPKPAAWLLDEDDKPTTVGVNDQGNLIVDDDGDPKILQPGADGLFRVGAIGLGCALVHSSVFEEIDKPWFRWTKGYEKHPWDLRHERGQPGVSEDFFFCHRLAEAGYDIHLDTSVTCAHEKGCLLTDDGVFLESQLSAE